MDRYIYEVVEAKQLEWQEAEPGRDLLFDFEDGDRYFFTSAINVVRFIYIMSKYKDRISTNETDPAYEFCKTYGEKYPSEQLLSDLEEDDGGYWFTVQENYDPEKGEKDPVYYLISDNVKSTKYYHIVKHRLDDILVEARWI